jgi:DNA-binding response OmpR family regulator
MRKRILIVDDDPAVAKLLKMVFVQKNHHVIIAEDGETAIEKVSRESPDLIISDVAMPGIDGFEFYSRLQKNSKTAGIPFIFVSGRKEPAEQLKGLRMGAAEYVTKPFDLKTLYQTVENVFVKAEKQKIDFGGNLESMNLEDIIQIIEMNVKTGELMFTIHNDQHIGSLFFKKGKIIYAITGSLDGEEALYELVAKKEGYAGFYSKEINMPEKISGSNMSLLLEGARMQDEGKTLYRLIDKTDVSFHIRSRRISPKLIEQLGRDWTTKILIMIDKNHTPEMMLNSGMMSRCRAECILAGLINAGLIEVAKEAVGPECANA